MRILAIDPGPEKSGYVWVTTDDFAPGGMRIDPGDDEFTPAAGKVDNFALLDTIREFGATVVIEWMSSYGRPVGAETFEACYWAGRFAEAAGDGSVARIERSKVTRHLIGGSRKKGDPTADAMIRRALMDRFGGDASIRKGGALYGVHGDAWAALAVAVCYSDGVQ